MGQFPIGILEHIDAFAHGEDRFDIGVGKNKGHEKFSHGYEGAGARLPS
jgi:hypothetical protein